MDSTLLEQINQMKTTGREAEVAPLLAKYVMANPQDPIGWYLLSQYVTQKERKLDCLDRALRLKPDMAEAQQARLELTTVTEYASEAISDEVMRLAEKVDIPPESLLLADIDDSAMVVTSVKPAVSAAAPQSAHQPLPKSQPNKRKKPAGESTRMMAVLFGKKETRYHKLALTVLLVIIAMIPAVFLFAKQPMVLLGMIGGLLLLKVIGDRVIDARNAARKKRRSFAKGARGESVVGGILDALGEEYRVWHDVPASYGNIDHVVLSKRGQIFMIETKAHSGRVTFAGNRLLINGDPPEKDMIQQCLNNLYALQTMVEERAGIKPWVAAILVFTNAYVERIPPVKSIIITYARNLKWMIEFKVKQQKPCPELWAQAEALDGLFARENRTYRELKAGVA